MGRLAYKLSCGDTRTTCIVFGGFSTAQFVTEILFFLCFAVYIAEPLSTATKVFYGIAAGFAPIFLLSSTLYINGVSKNESKWMNFWFITHGVVTISEIIVTIIGFIFLNDLSDIVAFYASAWRLAQNQQTNPLFIGDYKTCTKTESILLPSSGDGITFVGFFSQQGAAGLIAFLAILLIFKNFLNIIMLYVSYIHYHDLKKGKPKQRF